MHERRARRGQPRGRPVDPRASTRDASGVRRSQSTRQRRVVVAGPFPVFSPAQLHGRSSVRLTVAPGTEQQCVGRGTGRASGALAVS
jgi:hypothetical protein